MSSHFEERGNVKFAVKATTGITTFLLDKMFLIKRRTLTSQTIARNQKTLAKKIMCKPIIILADEESMKQDLSYM
jgi:hypothetical protein